jgi:hypothetical protein
MTILSKVIEWLYRFESSVPERSCAVCGSDEHTERMMSGGMYLGHAVLVCPESGEFVSY